MCFIISLIPATVLTAIGFIVLVASTRVGGGMRKFGKILAVWIFVIAAIPVLGGAYVTASGACPMTRGMAGHMESPA